MVRGLVTIVITCFNEERFIAEAIESAQQQTYEQSEIIVVDDGSSDESVEVVRRVAPHAKLIVKANGGLSSARNVGSDAARGEFVLFLDGDDLLRPEFVEKTVELLNRHPGVAYVYTQREFFGRESKVSNYPAFNLPDLLRDNYISASSTIRRSACAAVRFDEKLVIGSEDWDFFLSLAEQRHEGLLLDEPVLLYRKHEHRSSMSDRLKFVRSARSRRQLRLRIMRRHLKLFGVRRYLHYLAHHVKTTITDKMTFFKSAD